ncbi:MAG: hypothetical protein CBD88_00520 [Flavobacteriales bacterium TMED228]|mgnify:FL=1|nr:MAG: hypothetical protein CBD88_00520 [Flavobacteriales bacterium TMED228]|tara:strand:+ start:3564 stop:3770 length:207 start_codon:yes stop_codon:yes gene_type:complete
MRLPLPMQEYSSSVTQQTNNTLEQEDKKNFKKDTDININDGRLILKSPNGTRYNITVDNSGNITASTI